MSVVLQPSTALSFSRPLLDAKKRSLSLTIYNTNEQPVAFKVKTTAPRVYNVRPNYGRIEPGQSVKVSLALQGLRKEPPMGVKCRDKFLIQSTVMTPEKETLAMAALWNPPGTITEDMKVHEQKLRVVYLPADGQDIAKGDAAGQPTAVALCRCRREKSVDAHAHTAAKGQSAWARFMAGLKWRVGCGLGMTREQMYQKLR